MADVFTTMEQVAREALVQFHNFLGLGATANTSYKEQFNSDGSWDRGGSVTIRKPNRVLVVDGATLGSQDLTERTTTLDLTFRKHVPLNFTTSDMTHVVKQKFTERFIDPAVLALANQVETSIADEMRKAFYFYNGSAGTSPSTFKNLADIRAKMNLLGIPMDKRQMFWNEDDFSSFASDSKLQNSFDKDISTPINRDMFIGRLAGMTHFSSPVSPVQQAGTGDAADTPASGLVGAGNVKTLVVSGTVIVLENLANNSTFKVGDKLQIAGVRSVNPITRQSTGKLMTFTITADADSTSGTEVTLAVSPSVVSDTNSPYRNIDNVTGIAAGVSSAVSLVTGNTDSGSTTLIPYRMNLAYHQDAINFAAPPLVIPDSVLPAASGRAVDDQTGISLRVIKTYNGSSDIETTRLDILYGIRINAEYIVGLLGGKN